MSDTENQNTENTENAEAADKADAKTETRTRTRAAKAEQHFATLHRGSNYAVRHEGRIYRFKKGVELAIPASLQAHLEKTAVDVVTISSGDGDVEADDRQKFKFRTA